MKHYNRMKHMIAGALAAMTLTTAAIPAFTLNAAAAETQTVSAADVEDASPAPHAPQYPRMVGGVVRPVSRRRHSHSTVAGGLDVTS